MHIRIPYIQALLTTSVKTEPQKRLQKSWISSKRVAVLLSFLSWAPEDKLSFIYRAMVLSQANWNTS